MAIAATEIFKRHPDCYSGNLARLYADGGDPHGFSNLHSTREPAESIAINRISGGAVIMAGSGMCTGGRIRHHLRHNLWRPEAGIVFVGFAAQGTLGRRTIEGAPHINLFGEEIAARARVHTINGFSAHADQRELVAWHQGVADVETTFLVHGEEPVMAHGEEPVMAALAPLLAGHIEMPALHQVFQL